MGLPLVALLILAPPAYFPPARGAQLFSARHELVSRQDEPISGQHEPVVSESSGAQRIGWARGRILEDDHGRFWASPGCPLGLVRAVEWVDSLPLKVDVRGGAVTVTLRVNGP